MGNGPILNDGNDNSNSNSNSNSINMGIGNAAINKAYPRAQPNATPGFNLLGSMVPPSPGKLLGGMATNPGAAPDYAGSADEYQQWGPNAATVNISGGPRQQSGGPISSAGDGSSYGGRDSGPGSALEAVNADTAARNAPGKSYTAPGGSQPTGGIISDAVNRGLPSGAGEPMGADGRPSMTTEQSNAYYGPINAAMTAKTEQDQQQNRAISDAQSNASVQIERKRMLDNDLMRAKNSSATQGMRNVQFAQAQSNAANKDTMAANSALTAARTGRDYTKEAGASQDMIQKAREAQLGEAAKSQGLVSGQQGIQKGAFELKHADLVQSIAQRLSQAKQGTPEYSQLMGLYRTMINKDASNFKTQVVPGGSHYDPANPSIPVKDPDRVVTQDMNEAGGQPHEVVLGQQASAGPQLKEGQTGTVDGKRVVIKNGKPVPV